MRSLGTAEKKWRFAAVVSICALLGGAVCAASEIHSVRTLTEQLLRAQAEQARPILERRAAALVELIRTDPKSALEAALTPQEASGLTARLPDSAGLIESRGRWSGPAHLVSEDDFEQGIGQTVVWIETGQGTMRVHPAEIPSGLNGGDSVVAEGIQLGGEVAARVARLAPRADFACPATTGEQRFAVVAVDFAEKPFPTDVVTIDELRDIYLSATRPSVAQFWHEASYGKARVTGDVFGPVRLNFRVDLNNYYLLLDQIIAALDPLLDFTKYDRLTILVPGIGFTGWSGRGELGCSPHSSPSKGAFSASLVWMFAGTRQPYSGMADIAAHEAGHNLGMHHANTLDFAPQAVGAPGQAGVAVEYGDMFSNMGSTYGSNTYLSHYAAPHKTQIGWLENGSTQASVTTGGTFRLAPYEEASSALKALRIRRDSDSNKWLWLEYRQPTGFDAAIGTYSPQAVSGALIHYEDPDQPDSEARTLLLDFTAAATPHVFKDAALASGQSWSDPYGPLTLRAANASPTGLDITVQYEEPCASLSPVSASFDSQAGTGAISVTAAADCSWTTTSMNTWIVVLSGQSGKGAGTVTYAVAANLSPLPRTGALSIARRAFTVQQAGVEASPRFESLKPNSGKTNIESNDLPVFEFVVSDANGAADIRVVRALFNTEPSPAGGCLVEYDRAAGAVRLGKEDGSGWSDPKPLVVEGGAIENTLCLLDVAVSDAGASGTKLTVSLALRFRPPFVGAKNIYVYAEDAGGLKLDWQKVGTWTVYRNEPPSAVSVSPVSGSGLVQTFTAVYSDPNGAADISQVNIGFLASTDRWPCYVAVTRLSGVPTFWLFKDDGSGYYPAIVAGSAQTVSNSKCGLDASASSIGMSGNQVTATFALVFFPEFSGTKMIGITASDLSGAKTPSGTQGQWTIPNLACTYTVDPGSADFDAATATGSVSISTGDGCPWLASADQPWITLQSPLSGLGSGRLTYKVAAKPQPETRTGTITIRGQTVTVTQHGVPVLPRITTVLNGASFLPGFASAAWIGIFGTNLASTTRLWGTSDFNGSQLPAQLDGVSVTVNSRPAYVNYISPTQINALAPDDTALGEVLVQVTTAQGPSNTSVAQKQAVAPAFFMLDPEQRKYVVALHYPDYTLAGRPNLYQGVATRPARPGDLVLLYGTGFGPTSPLCPTGELVAAAARLSNPVSIRIGGATATVEWAGLTLAGLYQFNVRIPDVPDGDQPVVAEIGGLRTQNNAYVTVQR